MSPAVTDLIHRDAVMLLVLVLKLVSIAVSRRMWEIGDYVARVKSFSQLLELE